MKTTLYPLLGVLLLTNCTTQKESEPQIVQLSPDILDKAVTIPCDTVQLAHEFPIAECYYMYNDSIVIVQNHGQSDGYYLEFYNYRENRIVKQMLTQGKGPNEAIAITPTPLFFGSKMLSGDIGTQQLLILDIDSLLTSQEYAIPKYPVMYAGGLSFGLFQNKLIAENPNCFKSDELGIELESNRFIVGKQGDGYNLEFPGGEYNAINVTNGGQILTNEEKGIVCYAGLSESFVEFYDKELNLTKKITGPCNKPITYSVIENNFIVFKGQIPYAYFTSCSSQNYIYLLYVNAYWEEMKDEPNQGNYYIFKMDWDGNVVKTYKTNYLLNNIRCLTSKETQQDVLYGTIESEDGDVKIMRLVAE